MPNLFKIAACAIALCAFTTAHAQSGKTEVVWINQAMFKITTPGGKVIVTDPWMLKYPPALPTPLTPAEYPSLESLG